MTKSNLFYLFGSAFLCAALASRGSSEDRKIAMADAPVAVQKTLTEQLRSGKLRSLIAEVENGRTTYEEELTVDGRNKTVAIQADGRLLESETSVNLNSLPAAVRDGLVREARKGSLSQIEEVTKDGVVSYEAMVKEKGKKDREIVVGADGRAIAPKQ